MNDQNDGVETHAGSIFDQLEEKMNENLRSIEKNGTNAAQNAPQARQEGLGGYYHERIMLELKQIRAILEPKAKVSRPIVVAYDDQPERYRDIALWCSDRGWFFCCVEHPAALEQVLDQGDVLAVLLDHDLRDVDGELFTGVSVAQRCLVHRDVPVIITSANRAGANNIARTLRYAETPFYIESVIDPSPERRWTAILMEVHNERSRRKS